MLEVVAGVADESLLNAWRERVAHARERLGWARAAVVVRSHVLAGSVPSPSVAPLPRPNAGPSPSTPAASSLSTSDVPLTNPPSASLAFAAPCDQLFVATEINEWALCASLVSRDPDRWAGLEAALQQAAIENAEDPESIVPPVLEESAALDRLVRLAQAESRPLLQPLIDSAVSRDLPYVLDDTILTLGAGTGSVDFNLDSLPTLADAPWQSLHDIPTALVTGSNGKTTTVRLLAACSRAYGWHVTYSSTDGVFFDGEVVDAGDYSGPAGARLAVRDRRAQAAILETARGGILRRGIAVSRAQVSIVTNVSSDHFGEYGIYDLEGLADVKLTVGAVVPPSGLLVLNADDALLRAKVNKLAERYGRCPPLGWFARDGDAEFLREHRAGGGSTCGVQNGHLCIFHTAATHDLGEISAMPLTVDGAAGYNIANLAGAALGAIALGIPPSLIASVFGQFGGKPTDNPGRMMRFDVGGIKVVVDYAHNADGLRGLLNVAQHLRGGAGRLGLLLGHAGNRRNTEIEELAHMAAGFHPDLVVVKENEGHLRGREQGEVPQIIRAALLDAGMPESALPIRMTELEAARCALEWARPGDVLALLVHSSAARAAVLSLLQAQAQSTSQ